MSKNIGKVFEQEFKSSIPSTAEYWYYRFKDGTASFGGSEKTRFQATNICDCEVMTDNKLVLIELKNTNGASLPISNIKTNQLVGLAEIHHNLIEQYFIVCFREKERCFGVKACDLKSYIDTTDKKSIPLNWFEVFGIEIEMTRKRVNFNYGLEDFFKKI